MLSNILCAIWFFLPAGAANAAPIIVMKVPGLKRLSAPIDLGLQFHGKRVLGDHKTWRGLLAGMAAAAVMLWLQQRLAAHYPVLHIFIGPVDGYASLPVAVGAALGFGALAGDAAKSFFKRQRGTPPGESWFPFDQIDYIIGAAAVALLTVHMNAYVYLWAFLLWPVVHIASTAIGYTLGLKDQIL